MHILYVFRFTMCVHVFRFAMCVHVGRFAMCIHVFRFAMCVHVFRFALCIHVFRFNSYVLPNALTASLGAVQPVYFNSVIILLPRMNFSRGVTDMTPFGNYSAHWSPTIHADLSRVELENYLSLLTQGLTHC